MYVYVYACFKIQLIFDIDHKHQYEYICMYVYVCMYICIYISMHVLELN